MKKIIIILISLILLPVSVFAEVSVSLKLNRYEAVLADSVKMTISVSGARDSDNPLILGLENFIVQNAGKSSRMQILNGRVSSGLDYTYILQPKRIGTFTIGPASVKVDGKAYYSGAVTLLVKNVVDHKEEGKVPVFLHAALSSKRVYLEEQIQYTVKLYHLPDVSNVSLTMPEAEGLTFKQLGKHAEYTTVYNARNYKVIEIRYSLIPSRTGRLEISPARMSMLAHIRSKQDDSDEAFPADDFFSRIRGKSVNLVSNPVVLDVLPVPEAWKPADYAGLVGNFQIAAEIAPARIKAGESATFTVTLKGYGNINRIPDLKMPEIKNAKIYADEPKLEILQSEKGLEGKKTMKWAIVPVKEGQYIVPPLSASYFNTATRTYSRIMTRQLFLFVDSGTGVISESPFAKDKTHMSGKESKESKELIGELGKDIQPIHRSAKDLSKTSSGAIGFYWLLIFFPALIYAAFAARDRITNRSPESGARLKASRAANIFYKISKDEDLSANAFSNALRDYFNSRFAMELGALTPKEISDILKANGCPEETINQMEWILKKVETLIFTGKGKEPCDLSDETIIIIKSIEKEIK